MNTSSLEITANFWSDGAMLPTVEEQYADLWRFAKVLQSIGIPLDEWCPPADTEANAKLNAAFNEHGPTPAALAMANATKRKNSDARGLGAWNGVEDAGGMVFTTLIGEGPLPCNFNFSARGVPAFDDYANVLTVVRAVLEIWSPVMLLAGPFAYRDLKVFKDRPSVSWMVYLPFRIETHQAPEASALIPVMGEKVQKGTIVVSVTETFDVDNPEHVKRANDLEVRLADQDLLPRFMEFMKFKPLQE